MSVLTTIADLLNRFASQGGFDVIWLSLLLASPFIVFLLVGAAYIMTLQNTLKAISVQNRTIQPEQIRWLLIPLFGLIWHFRVVKRIDESIQNEYSSMKQPNNDTTTYEIGRAMCILNLCWLLPVVGEFAIIASFICFVIYWIRIRSYRDKLSPLGGIK